MRCHYTSINKLVPRSYLCSIFQWLNPHTFVKRMVWKTNLILLIHGDKFWNKCSLNKSFNQGILQKSFWGSLFLFYGCNSRFSLGNTVIPFSTRSFHWEAKGKKTERKYSSRHSRAPFPCGWPPHIGRKPRSVSPSVPFCSSPPAPLKRASLEAGAYYLEIQSCIFSVLCADGETGEGTSRAELNSLQCREHHESPELQTDE